MVLSHFQVIDEADRLLAQSFQEWLAQVLAAIHPPPRSVSVHMEGPSQTESVDAEAFGSHDALAPAWLHSHAHIRDIPTDLDDEKIVSCQKLLFSATLTRDPDKIAAIGLKDPKYFVVQSAKSDDDVEQPLLLDESFAMPATLTVCELRCIKSFPAECSIGTHDHM